MLKTGIFYVYKYDNNSLIKNYEIFLFSNLFYI